MRGHHRRPCPISLSHRTGESILRDLLRSNQVIYPMCLFVSDKELHCTAKIPYRYPRKSLRTGTDGGSYLGSLQRAKHLLHRSPVRRKHYAKACDNEPCRFGTVFRLFFPRIAKIGQKAFSTGTGIFVHLRFRRIITYGRSRNHQFRFRLDCIQSTDNTIGYDNTTVEKLLFIFRCPTFIDRCTCQVDDNITMGQCLNQITGHTFAKHRPSQRNDPMSALFCKIIRKMFTYISGSSGHCYIHLDSLFILTLLEKRIKCKKSSLKKAK